MIGLNGGTVAPYPEGYAAGPSRSDIDHGLSPTTRDRGGLIMSPSFSNRKGLCRILLINPNQPLGKILNVVIHEKRAAFAHPPLVSPERGCGISKT